MHELAVLPKDGLLDLQEYSYNLQLARRSDYIERFEVSRFVQNHCNYEPEGWRRKNDDICQPGSFIGLVG